MSATPEQIADVVGRYSRDAYSKAEVASRTEGLEHAAPQMFADADHLRAAAALIRAQAERVRVLEEALTIIGHSLVCAPVDYAEHNASELLRAGNIARAALNATGAPQ